MVVTRSMGKVKFTGMDKSISKRGNKHEATNVGDAPKKKITSPIQQQANVEETKTNRRSPRLSSKQISIQASKSKKRPRSSSKKSRKRKKAKKQKQKTKKQKQKSKKQKLEAPNEEILKVIPNTIAIYNVRKKRQPFVIPKPSGRLIVFDTETTGLGFHDRIVEIGGVELIDGKQTGDNFQSYVNCQRKSHWGALRCHGLTCKFLSKFRGIKEVVADFME